MLACVLAVGVSSGLGIVAFHEALQEGSRLLVLGDELGIPRTLYLLLLPAAGGLLVGLWVQWLKPGGPGQGVAGIIEAATYHRGRIAPRCALARVLGAVITLTTGGSAGPEDPSVQLGATLGSQIGQALRLSESRMRTLIACGSAAAVAAAFKAPITGVFFAVEVILGEFSTSALTYVILAAVAAAATSQIFLSSQPAFTVPAYELHSPVELVTYLILGMVAALIGVAYVRLLQMAEDRVEHWRFPPWLKPAVGGLLVGGIAAAGRPEVLGVGYESLGAALNQPGRAVWLLFFLVALKLLATVITIGSGGQGGLFAPSLFIGGMLGVGFGSVAHALAPAITAPAGAYGLVAMGAVLASAIHAPIVAILLPFEMTNDYRIIVPLMLAVVTSYLVARRLEPESVYTLKLKARGIDLAARRDQNIMRTVTVGEAMTRDFPTVTLTMPLTELGDLLADTGHHGFPVLDESGQLAGIVTLQDYEQAIEGREAAQTVADIYTADPITALEDESLEEVMRRFGEDEVGRVPVVARDEPRRLVGILRRSDITRAYGRALAQQSELRQRQALATADPNGSNRLAEITIPPEASCAGQTVSTLHLPDECILVSIRRGQHTLIPHGDTVLEPGDRVLAVVENGRRRELERCLTCS